MLVKLLMDIVSEVAGQGAIGIVDVLNNKKNVNEFLIAKKLNLTINQTRNILYRLADHDLVGFIRKKDTKKGGWYTYFWTLNTRKALEFLKERVSARIDAIEKELSDRRKKRYYYCAEIDVEYSEEEALEHGFICPETGDVLELRDNKDLVAEFGSKIGEFRGLLSAVNNELEIIGKKEDRAKDRLRKLEAKRKEEERLKRKRKREREAKKLGKCKKKVKKVKKKVKKKLKKGKKKLKKGKKKVKKLGKKVKKLLKKVKKGKKSKKKKRR